MHVEKNEFVDLFIDDVRTCSFLFMVTYPPACCQFMSLQEKWCKAGILFQAW